jgi:hypothetical protein
VLDKTTRLPVANANVAGKAVIAFTAALGRLNLTVKGFGDTVNISYIGYKTYHWVAGFNKYADTVYLVQNLMMLNEVSIQNQRNFKLDSARIREQYARVFAYKGTQFTDIFIKRNFNEKNAPMGYNVGHNTSNLVSVDLLSVLALIGKNHTQTSTLQKALLRDEDQTYIDQLFSKQKVSSITALKGDSLKNFMVRYRPSISQAKKLNSYDMMLYIKKRYAEFVTIPAKDVASPFGK